MIVTCAWCQRDGKPAILGEKEPLENRGITHTLCPPHEAEWIAEAERSRAARLAAAVVAS